MIIDLGRLPEGGETFIGEEPNSILEMGKDEFVTFRGPIQYELEAYIVSGSLIVRGKVGIEASFQCSRCTDPVPMKVEDKDFLQTIEVGDETESVDLTGDIREAMLLIFPAYPLCSVECKGLCSQCGINLNKGTCACVAAPDVRWNDLGELNIQE